MNSAIRKARILTNLCNSTHKSFTSQPKSTPHHPKTPQRSNLSPPIPTFLLKSTTTAVNWDSLTAAFPSAADLTDALIETTLLSLTDPSAAKTALLFFHWSASRRPSPHSVRSYALAVHLLVRAGLLADARALLESAILKYPTIPQTLSATLAAAHSGPRVFDLLLQTYAKLKLARQSFDALLFLEEQQHHGFTPTLITFNSLLHSAQRSGEHELCWKVFEHMINKRVYPNQASVQTMIDLMCKEGSLLKNIAVVERIIGSRCAPGVIVAAALAFRIIDDNRVDDAIVLLKRMLQKNMVPDGVVYSAIVSARCGTGELELALELFDEMLMRGCSSNAFVRTAFVKACCKEGRIDEACRLMREMEVVGLKPYDETYSCLIEGCSRLGRVEESLVFFQEMIGRGFLPDCSACNVMFRGLCEAGEVEKADEILSSLLERGFKANEATYIELINGFGRIAKADGILKLYYEMKHKNIDLNVEFYTSMVKSLRQCGKLKEAETFQSMMEEKTSSSPLRDLKKPTDHVPP